MDDALGMRVRKPGEHPFEHSGDLGERQVPHVRAE